MKRITSGALLVGTGLIHCLVGLVLGWEPTAAIISDGLVGAVETDPLRMAIFWFQFGGVMMILLGAFMRHVEQTGAALPRWLGGSLIALGLGGGLFIPASGFWLVVPQGLWLMRRQPAATA